VPVAVKPDIDALPGPHTWLFPDPHDASNKTRARRMASF
jgi:hypothetical protein